MSFIKTTEQDSHHNNLEKKSIFEIITKINYEDKKVPSAVEKVIPKIEKLIKKVVKQLDNGGRLFYIGAGTSGRLGILDASECPPTFGVPHGMVVGLIAGGDIAIKKSVELAEDDTRQGWKDLKNYDISSRDIVIGIAASGTTPYAIGALKACQKQKIPTGCITCNAKSPLTKVSDYPIEVVVGPELVTGSSRMKSGTAQKLILNMITTTAMIKLGHIKDNKMIDMQLSNHKLMSRGIRILMNELQIKEPEAQILLAKYKSVRAAINAYENGN